MAVQLYLALVWSQRPPLAGKPSSSPGFFKTDLGKNGEVNAPMFLPNLSPYSPVQKTGTSPSYHYSSSAPDTILRMYVHANEPFQNNFSDVPDRNRLFSDMPVQQHLLLIARVFSVLISKASCLSLSAGAPPTSSAPCPSLPAAVFDVRLWWGGILGRVCAPNVQVAVGLQVALNPSLH